jgi:phosphoribosylanthranilate isomerase
VAVTVKICGITNLADAVTAVEAGADALGFIFYPQSKRCISVSTAASIIREVPAPILKVGVFVNVTREEALATQSGCGLTVLQFHGDEPPEYCAGFNGVTWKAFRVEGVETLRRLPTYNTSAWLLDAWSPAMPGGTGERFDWDLALEAQDAGRPIILAGGLTPENVAGGIQRVRPWGVDVSSGVELSPGRKDAAKVKAFIQAAKAA